MLALVKMKLRADAKVATRHLPVIRTILREDIVMKEIKRWWSL